MKKSFKMKKLISLSVFLVLIAFTNTTLRAQNNANVLATAEVVVALNVQNVQNLEFGQVLQGDTSELLTAGNAGQISIQGSGDASVDVLLDAVPTALTGPGADIPINGLTISSSDVANSLGTDFTNSAQGDVEQLVLSATGNKFVFFRGSITPAGTQTAGSYSETFTITVNYN